MDLENFQNEIKKTGFVLENEAAKLLKKDRWTVISNKYYVDDQEDSVREIDLVAYKVAKVHHFDVYTVLVISCKKSEQDAWAMLSRPINLKDPNSDWWPLHAWSNDKAVQFQLNQTGAAKRYHESLVAQGVSNVLDIPDVEVFAFQEMDKKSGKAHNDKNIFNSVTSLIKAQAYELSALPTRKKNPSIYQFNLVSIADTEIIRLMFHRGSIKATEVDSEHYLARYIVRKREIFSRIRFVRSSAFEGSLADYTKLFNQNCNWFDGQLIEFYRDVEKSSEKMGVFGAEFARHLKWPLRWRVQKALDIEIDPKDPYFFWSKNSKCLMIVFNFPTEVAEFLNTDTETKETIAAALKKWYRYSGLFEVSDLPF